MEVPDNLRKAETQPAHIATEEEEQMQSVNVRNRKGVKDFWGKFKDGIIDLFKEEEDHTL